MWNFDRHYTIGMRMAVALMVGLGIFILYTLYQTDQTNQNTAHIYATTTALVAETQANQTRTPFGYATVTAVAEKPR